SLSAQQQTIGNVRDPLSSNVSNWGSGVPEPQIRETIPPSEISANPISETYLQQPIVPQEQTSPNNSHTGTYTSTRQGVSDSTSRTCVASTTNLHFTTPRRPAQAVGFSTPTVIVFQTPPLWARFDAEREPNFQEFPPGATALFTGPSATIKDADSSTRFQEHPISSNNYSTYVSHQDPLLGDFPPAGGSGDLDVFSAAQTSHPDPYLSSSAHNLQSTIPAGASMTPATQAPSTALVVRTLRSNFSQMYDMIKQTLRPTSTLQNLDSIVAMVHVPCTGVPNALAYSHTGSVTHANSLLIDDWSSREGSIARNSPAPVTIAGHSPVPTSRSNGNTHNWSKKVRKKESSIRNLFQTGLLSIVEEGYGVNSGTIDKLNELISQSHYIYAEYNIEMKKVSGRYRHPCLMRILRAILFTKCKHGCPIGVCFMPEIMGGINLTDVPEESGGNGITAPMIALACTLALYGLQSIRAGDSSQRVGTRKEKPVHFTEK
ncbi:hypothetical protein FRC11_000074, partial [Ceratobasidium sp. 423]